MVKKGADYDTHGLEDQATVVAFSRRRGPHRSDAPNHGSSDPGLAAARGKNMARFLATAVTVLLAATAARADTVVYVSVAAEKRIAV
jgi:hypothetical protein